MGRGSGTKTPKGKTSGAHPNNPRRKEWEAFTRFSASAISWTASRSFPALSMSPAAAKASSADLLGSRDDLALPLAGTDTQALHVWPFGICSPTLHLNGSLSEATTTVPRRLLGRAGRELGGGPRILPDSPEEGEGAWPSGGVLGQDGLQGFKECKLCVGGGRGECCWGRQRQRDRDTLRAILQNRI